MADNTIVSVLKDARDTVMRHGSQVHWVRLGIAVLGFILLSFGLSYLFQRVIAQFSLARFELDYLAYAVVFFVTLLSNLTIIAPVPFAVSIMVAAAARWNPVLIALAAAAGGTLGELSGYYAGYLGKKLAISDNVFGYHQIETWVRRFGLWAIFVLGVQPFIPFDIGGMVAGAARMPLHLFMPALFIAKVIKYIMLTVLGAGIIHRFPGFS